MGTRYRKSIKMGPFRINFSKSGIGYSYGVKGYRVTKTATGRTRTTVSIPGTGISHVTETKSQPRPRPAAKPAQERKPEKFGSLKIWVAIIAGLVMFFWFAAGCSADQPAGSAPVDPPAASSVVPDSGTPDTSEPMPEPEPEPEPEPVPEPEPEPVPEPEPEPVPEPEPEPKQEPVTPAPAPDPEPEKEKPVDYTYIGNKNSKVFHQSNCGSVTRMKDKNKVPFGSRDAAISAGYEPCDNCTP